MAAKKQARFPGADVTKGFEPLGVRLVTVLRFSIRALPTFNC